MINGTTLLSDFVVRTLDMPELLPLWDDLYLLVPIYMAAVGFLRRFGPYSEDKSLAKGYKVNNDFWKPVMILYNIAMTLFSFTCFTGMVYVIFVRYEGQWASPKCNLISDDPLFLKLVYAFYVSKYVEFADTLFLIVKGKGVSWLHFLHHCGAALTMGSLYYARMEAVYLFVMLNGFIHTIMYAYYGTALLGIRLPGKSMITSAQILQFIVGLALFWRYKNIPCVANSTQLMFCFYFIYVYVSMVLGFFVNFFVNSYVLSKPEAKKVKFN